MKTIFKYFIYSRLTFLLFAFLGVHLINIDYGYLDKQAGNSIP